MPTDKPMQLGMVGLGRMGSGLVRRLTRDGHHCVGYDRNADVVKSLEGEGIAGANSLEEFASKLEKPRTAWVMVPAGDITTQTIRAVAEVFEPGDTIIDGGNTHYHDDLRHAAELREKGIHHIDVGTSGGVYGLERGFCLMIGGEDEVVERLYPLFGSIAPGVGGSPAHARADRRSQPIRDRLPALRPERRRPLREDGPQRDRVRDHGRVRRGAEHHQERERRQVACRNRTPRPRRWSTPSTTCTTSTPPR